MDTPVWLEITFEDIAASLVASYPHEGCGFVVESASGIHWRPCENVARDTTTFFAIDPIEFIRAEDRGARVIAIVHSHADLGDHFSEDDVAGALIPGDPPQPTYPGVDHLVVSVRRGRAEAASIFRFDRGGFLRIYRGWNHESSIVPDVSDT